MTILCGTEWGALWGSYYGPCDTTDHVTNVLSNARARLLEGTTYNAMVTLIGETYETIEHDAWQLEQRFNISVASGVMLDDLGFNAGLTRIGSWTDGYYRRILGAWIPNQYGVETIAKLMALLDALSDGAVAYTVSEYFPCHVWIDLVGIDGDTASIWVQVLEAARPKGIQFWVSYAVTNPAAFVLGDSYLGGPDVLAGVYVL